MSSRKARATNAHSTPKTWREVVHSSVYVSVVHGRNRKPRNGRNQLSNARLRSSVNSASRMIASRGESRAMRTRKQPTDRMLAPSGAERGEPAQAHVLDVADHERERPQHLGALAQHAARHRDRLGRAWLGVAVDALAAAAHERRARRAEVAADHHRRGV